MARFGRFSAYFCTILAVSAIGAADLVAAADAPPDAGRRIYANTCSMCHDAGVAGAPKFGDKLAWAVRIEQGVDVLHQHALSGINAMPPRGTCAACSDTEIASTVDYMINAAR